MAPAAPAISTILSSRRATLVPDSENLWEGCTPRPFRVVGAPNRPHPQGATPVLNQCDVPANKGSMRAQLASSPRRSGVTRHLGWTSKRRLRYGSDLTPGTNTPLMHDGAPDIVVVSSLARTKLR